ncbi:CE1759 family FMN reductase [Brachybacterium sp. p3-SID957]|uniref:CE1759 family FMN reductase n=1 Tax=Brachybacterium sp. p3-SID957 TaxID=2916049 RepID=UPI00223AF839|nr:CE1759 family FMN reductase [Brachybacterium sp. p3-SID957]MCT1776464.1 NAD(P)H-dependent oxidoreductase [Brachybacterium sp. p3-SID957]
MTEPIRIVALAAGLSTPSSTRMLADQLSRAARLELERTGAVVDVQTVELRELAHDITDAMLTRFTGERLGVVVESIRTADAVIAVTPVFNVGPSGLFKSFFDAMDIEIWKDKPVLLGATAGTPRHSLAIDYAIRPMFAYLKSQIVPTSVFAASADFGADTEGQADALPLSSRIRRAAAELAMMLRTTGAAAEAEAQSGGDTATTADGSPAESGTASSKLDAEFANFVPMGQLLGRD